MTRRYGWRAVLKAMKIEGTHKGSEVEIKILPVNSLSKLKQVSKFHPVHSSRESPRMRKIARGTTSAVYPLSIAHGRCEG